MCDISNAPLIREYVDEYKSNLESLTNGGSSVQDLMRAHSKIKKHIRARFKAKYPLETSHFINSNLETITASLSDILSEFLEKIRMRKEADTEIPAQEIEQTNLDPVDESTISDDFLPVYNEEYDNYLLRHKRIHPTKLEAAQTVISGEAIKKFKRMQALTKSQELELDEVARASFEILRSRTLMALYWSSDSEPAIGIDLGTTYCCSAIYLQGEVRIIPNRLGNRTTPSYVRLESGGSVVVGKSAKDNAYRYADRTVYDAKRLIGRRFEDPLVQGDMGMWSFRVKEGRHGPVICVNDREYPPEYISAILLRQLKKDAEAFLKCPVRKAVITVPAYFNDAQRQATIDAGEMAGLQVLTILNEPTAAAMAYKLERFHMDTKYVLIFDFGGGTFDVALLKTNGQNFEIISVDGDTHLGGQDIDKSLVKHCAEYLLDTTAQLEFQFEEIHSRVNLLKDSKSSNEKTAAKARACLRRIQSKCEEGKIELSSGMFCEITIDHVFEENDMSLSVSREEMKKLNEEVWEKIEVITARLLRSAKVGKEEISDVVLVGGSTKIPLVRAKLQDFFHSNVLNHTINPDEAVAYGAAIQAAILSGSKESSQNDMIGDVVPMSLGVECIENDIPGMLSIIIPKDTKIPTKQRKFYKTSEDQQTSAIIQIYQGERKTAAENTLLGKFVLNGIPPAPRQKEELEVIMEMQQTGVLKVTAVSRSSGRSKSLTVEEFRGRLPADLKKQITKEIASLKM